MISQNPATGDAFPNPNNPNGIPLVDIDLSFVDSVFVSETSTQVTDLYAGLTQTVTELTYDRAYCVVNSSPALVRQPIAVCTNSKIVPT